jgi:hypothetical protein
MHSVKRLPAREPPLTGESLTSLVRRQTIAMGYESIHRLKGVLSDGERIPYHLDQLERGSTLERLAKLIGITSEQLFDLTAHQYARQLMLVPPNNVPIERCDSKTILRFFRLATAPICSRCLAETISYERLTWKLRPIAMCLEHGCWLLDRCPVCQRGFRPGRLDICQCSCGLDLRSAPVTNISPQVEVFGSAIEVWLESERIPLTGLTAAACFWWSERLASAVLRTPVWLERIREEFHIPLRLAAEQVAWLAAAHILTDWPAQLETFLGVFQTVDKHRGTKTGINRAFGLLLREAAQLEKIGFSAPADALRSYLLERYTGGHLNSKVCLFKNTVQQGLVADRTWITQTEAARLLQVRQASIAELIARGLLAGSMHSAGKRTVGLVSRASVEKLRHQLHDSLTVPQVAQRLGIGRHRILDVIHENLLSDCVRTMGGWRIPREAIVRIETVYLKLPEIGLEQFTWTSPKAATRQLGSHGLTFVVLYKLVFTGQLRAARHPLRPGLGGLSIDASDLQRHLPNIQQERDHTDGYPLSRLAQVLISGHPIKEIVLRKWIAAGLLKANRLQRRWQVPVTEVVRFRNTYCLAHEACQILEISRSTLARWEGAGRIRPVYSRKQHDRAGASLFLRAEIKSLCIQHKAA